jgi:four helix bundle protein
MAVAVVTLSRKIDRDSRWLAVQVQRCAGSVPAHIVEGYARLSLREYLHHLSIARSSLAETEYWLHFSKRLGLLSAEQVAEVSPLIYGLVIFCTA